MGWERSRVNGIDVVVSEVLFNGTHEHLRMIRASGRPSFSLRGRYDVTVESSEWLKGECLGSDKATCYYESGDYQELRDLMGGVGFSREAIEAMHMALFAAEKGL